MKKFDLLPYSILVGRINYAVVCCRVKKEEGVTLVSNPDLDLYLEIAREMSEVCEQIGFEDSKYKADTLSTRLGFRPNPAHYSGVHIEMMHLHESLILDMKRHKFLQVDLPEYSDLGDSLLGTEVPGSFPSAKEDITAAAHCLAVDLNVAAVFHLMHVVEWGIRALCHHVGLSEVVSDVKRGKRLPIEYAQWGIILKQIDDKVQATVGTIVDRDDKQKAQRFYYSALQEIEGFKEAWRNHIMHTRGEYTAGDAVGVKSHVERFMKSLVKQGIFEVI
jgi:hypothetical protein